MTFVVVKVNVYVLLCRDSKVESMVMQLCPAPPTHIAKAASHSMVLALLFIVALMVGGVLCLVLVLLFTLVLQPS